MNAKTKQGVDAFKAEAHASTKMTALMDVSDWYPKEMLKRHIPDMIKVLKDAAKVMKAAKKANPTFGTTEDKSKAGKLYDKVMEAFGNMYSDNLGLTKLYGDVFYAIEKLKKAMQ